ncbi:MAG TPA: hypothetical protein VKS78_10350 [Roseiarcus sp.]|nr:hypothetical protein [Roseiarcus sp.]
MTSANLKLVKSEESRLLVYFEEETHIVRRLGAAVISCWQELPAPVRARLLEQSRKILDEEDTSLFDRQLKHFISENTREK